MKRSVYFTGVNHSTGQLEKAIESVVIKRDSWLKENEDVIGKIESESLQIITWSSNNNNAIPVIQITYYLKEE